MTILVDFSLETYSVLQCNPSSIPIDSKQNEILSTLSSTLDGGTWSCLVFFHIPSWYGQNQRTMAGQGSKLLPSRNKCPLLSSQCKEMFRSVVSSNLNYKASLLGITAGLCWRVLKHSLKHWRVHTDYFARLKFVSMV